MVLSLTHAVLAIHANATVTLETHDVSTIVKTDGGGKSEVKARYIQRKAKVLMVRASTLIGWNDGGRRGGIRAMADHHREAMADPMRRCDPHDRCGTLDLKDPKFKLS